MLRFYHNRSGHGWSPEFAATATRGRLALIPNCQARTTGQTPGGSRQESLESAMPAAFSKFLSKQGNSRHNRFSCLPITRVLNGRKLKQVFSCRPLLSNSLQDPVLSLSLADGGFIHVRFSDQPAMEPWFSTALFFRLAANLSKSSHFVLKTKGIDTGSKSVVPTPSSTELHDCLVTIKQPGMTLKKGASLHSQSEC